MVATTSTGVLVTCETERDFDRVKNRPFGFREIWEENEREEREDVRDEIESAICVLPGNGFPDKGVKQKSQLAKEQWS